MKTLEQHCHAMGESSHLPATVLSPIVSSKITTQHLARLAVVYVRQSSQRQVRENIESTQLLQQLSCPLKRPEILLNNENKDRIVDKSSSKSLLAVVTGSLSAALPRVSVLLILLRL